ncbi:testis-specific serine/threonine-protein kinase 3-like isoform X1 [Hermetia illucens]|uniref:testis-specific serine/threonine-protein kinase 3-like isoform X1 n=1 Tax=Hermetia illucens TaxID=343691 RepID=UPI0018CC38B2|nr:testis-specific serine/threonine-protein kinase 3-like isoform X1 [Hermetia illucens]
MDAAAQPPAPAIDRIYLRLLAATQHTDEKQKAASEDTVKPKPVTTSAVIKKTVLEDHGYTIGKQIGTGTYAKVKVAYSEEYKCPVAVKIISKVKAPAEYLKKFMPREIDVVKGLRHENLIRYYQSIETTHRVYIIMQFAENGSLLDLIRKEGYLDENRARKYFRQLIAVLDYCHNQGVVHRDIKCENLLFDKNYNIKLIDFGFARGNMKPNGTNIPLSETYCGSYAYASPEVLKGIPYQPQYSDIWASGVVLFAMVFGRLPFDGSTYAHLVKQVQNKVVFPRDPSVSSMCKHLITKIIAPLKVRITIDGIEEDPWFLGETATTSSDVKKEKEKDKEKEKEKDKEKEKEKEIIKKEKSI